MTLCSRKKSSSHGDFYHGHWVTGSLAVWSRVTDKRSSVVYWYCDIKWGSQLAHYVLTVDDELLHFKCDHLHVAAYPHALFQPSQVDSLPQNFIWHLWLKGLHGTNFLSILRSCVTLACISFQKMSGNVGPTLPLPMKRLPHSTTWHGRSRRPSYDPRWPSVSVPCWTSTCSSSVGLSAETLR